MCGLYPKHGPFIQPTVSAPLGLPVTSKGRTLRPPFENPPMTPSSSLILPPPGCPTVGIDEAGRGCWAGPVVAAAVLWGSEEIPDLNDSKQVDARRRALLVPLIQRAALAWGIGEASAQEIDRRNILQATFLAMERAMDELLRKSRLLAEGTMGQVWVDGNRLPPWRRPNWPMEAIVGGDGSHAPIAAASILAKEHRDALMRDLDARHPEYGFANHKSYGTAEHRNALAKHGPCPEHRMTFRPVREWIESRKPS